MSVYMTRNPLQPAGSNTVNPSLATNPQYQFYEKSYTSGTTQEWIYLPEGVFPIGVTLTPTGGTASLDVTDSPPDVVETGSAATTVWPVGIISAAVSTTLLGYTAFRVNRVSGTPKVSVRA